MTDIRNGEIYAADMLKDDSRYYDIIDRSGESYAYPKECFEVVDEPTNAVKEKRDTPSS